MTRKNGAWIDNRRSLLSKSFRANARAPRENRAERFAGTLRVAWRRCFSRAKRSFVSPAIELGQSIGSEGESAPKNFVIATGSRAAIPKIEGIDQVPYFTNETIFDELREKPESMIVLGGGPIGCELGQTFSRLGVKVTIVQRGAQLLPREDVDVAEFMQNRFMAEGVRVHLKAARKARLDARRKNSP